MINETTMNPSVKAVKAPACPGGPSDDGVCVGLRNRATHIAAKVETALTFLDQIEYDLFGVGTDPVNAPSVGEAVVAPSVSVSLRDTSIAIQLLNDRLARMRDSIANDPK